MGVTPPPLPCTYATISQQMFLEHRSDLCCNNPKTPHLSHSPRSLQCIGYRFPRAAETKQHTLCRLENKNVFSHSLRGSKSAIKVSAGPCSHRNPERGVVPCFPLAPGGCRRSPQLCCWHRLTCSLCLCLPRHFVLLIKTPGLLD